MNEDRVLCVDDDPNVLAAFDRLFRRRYEVHTATSAAAAMALLESVGPFALVISDRYMPGLDGIRFLARVREIAPQTVRMMLTGASDLETAVEAVNEGSIFRFMTKPCPPDTMAKAVAAGLDQYRLVTAERALLENTLTGSINVLLDVLAMTNPLAFSRAKRLQSYTTQIVARLGLPETWQFEVAAMLSQIGCVIVPGDVLERHATGHRLSVEEVAMLQEHPQVGARLLAAIPRLEVIAEMIGRQNEPCGLPEVNVHKTEAAKLGACILKAITDFDLLLSRGVSREAAVADLSGRPGMYQSELLACLNHINVPELGLSSRLVKVVELHDGMVIAEDIRLKNGLLMVPKGQEVTDTIRLRLRNFRVNGTIPESVAVIVPRLRIVPVQEAQR